MYRIEEISQRELLTGALSDVAAELARRAVSAARRFAQAIVNRRAVRRMSQFDDRMLADIGLSRSDISSALSQPVWVDPSRDLAETVALRRRGRLWGRPLRRS